MRTPLRFISRRLLIAIVSFSLTDALPLAAQSSSRHPHRGESPADQDDATPTPSPSSKKHRQKSGDDEDQAANPPAAAASPGSKNARKAETQQEKSSDAKPSSADEAAPSEAPVKDAASAAKMASPAAVSTIDPAEIDDFDKNPEPVRKLLTAALDLTRRNLTYIYGSTDPSRGGMDCSGTIYYLLNQEGFTDVPRQANEQYDWVRSKSRFYAVLSKKQDNFELREMRPGDLLFWTGTYRVDRDPPVTHAMIYLGKRKSDGHRLMFGASDGRPYDGQRRNGVSVFDFKMPAAKSGDAADAATSAAPDHAPDFSGYGPVPGLTDLADAALRQTTAAKGPTTDMKADAADPDAATPAPKAKKPRSGSRKD